MKSGAISSISVASIIGNVKPGASREEWEGIDACARSDRRHLLLFFDPSSEVRDVIRIQIGDFIKPLGASVLSFGKVESVGSSQLPVVGSTAGFFDGTVGGGCKFAGRTDLQPKPEVYDFLGKFPDYPLKNSSLRSCVASHLT